jgi:hypothetical protein
MRRLRPQVLGLRQRYIAAQKKYAPGIVADAYLY